MDNEERKRIWQQFMEKGTLDPRLPLLVARSQQECRRRGVDDMTQEEYRKAAIDACQKLADDVGIPRRLSELGVQEKDIDFLADSAMADACTPGNPRDVEKSQIVALYKSIL